MRNHYLILCSLCLAGSCSAEPGAQGHTESRGSRPKPAPPGLALPALSEITSPLAAPRLAALSEADVYRDGADYEAGLPSQRALPAGTALAFAPNFPLPASDDAEMAFALYRFDASGYDREPQLRLNWQTAPGAGLLYIALGDYAAGRWVFFQPAGPLLDLGDLAAYTAPDGSLTAALILLGEDPAVLSSLRLGEPYPEAGLDADVESGNPPLAVNLDAAASRTPEGSLDLFEWDFEGDGSFDGDSGSIPSVMHIYNTAGDFSPTVRVTNSFGHSATASRALAVLPPAPTDWMHNIGLDDNEYFNAVAVDSQGNVYAAGVCTSAADNYNDTLLTKWSADGTFLWGRIWDIGPFNSEAHDLALDSAGNPVTAGWFDPPGGPQDQDAVLLKWTPGGDLNWARCLSGAGDDDFTSVNTAGPDIYVAGHSDSFSSDRDVLVLRFAGDSSFVWARRYDWFVEEVTDSRLLTTSAGPQAIFTLVTETNPAPNPMQRFPLWVRYALNGDFEADGSCIAYSDFIADALALDYDEIGAKTNLYILGLDKVAGSFELELVGTDTNRASLFARTWENGTMNRGAGIELLGASDLLVCGHSDYDATLWRFSRSDGSALANRSLVEPMVDSDLLDLVPLGSEVLVAGYGQGVAGSWTELSGTQSSISHPWLFGAGLSYSETPAITDPNGDSVADWTGAVMDVVKPQDDSIIGRQPLP